jgi:two-component system NarL family sensor kinase
METITGSELIWLISAGIGLMGVLALLFVLYFLYSRKKVLNEQLQHQKLVLDHQKQLNTNAILTQDREQKRIARDLHDDIGAKLNVGLLYVRQLQRTSLSDEKAQEHLTDTEELLLRIIETNRQISHNLLPPTLQALGTKAAVLDLILDVKQAGSCTIQLDWPDTVTDLPKEKGIHLYRILQELIKNSLSHGQANRIQIAFAPKTEGGFEMQYQDNGKGFDPEEVKQHSPGLGTSNMESRAGVLGMSLSIHSAPGEGIRVRLTTVSVAS